MTKIYTASDYASLKTADLEFYYGYEVEDPETEDWCFTVKKGNKEIFRLTKTEIENQSNIDADDTKDYLTAGMGIWLSNVKISR